jgi:hypothetical protein
MDIIELWFLIVLWFRLLLLVLIPGGLVGWMLRRFCPHILAVAIAAEILTLIPAVWDLARLGWKDEAVEGLFLLHTYWLLPIFVAVSTGYFVAGYIRNRMTPSTANSSQART